MEKISSLIGKECDSKPVYGGSDKYKKAKIKLYGYKVIMNFQGKKVPKQIASYKFFY